MNLIYINTTLLIFPFSGAIQLTPHYGNQLGGAPIIVSGTDVKFGEGDDITCIFHDQEVKGVYVNEEQALCVSPQLSQTGTVLFQLQIVRDEPGSSFFSGEANYISRMSLKDTKHVLHVVITCHLPPCSAL